MRKLAAVRLVQWYHFQDETLDIGESCLLLGDNGSGKTTVLDAVQVALVADASEVLLNRAANEKSKRTLYGYVRWKLGSEDESRAGGVRFARGACTSYVVLEFSDDLDASLSFVCGLALEATEQDTEVVKLFFVVPGARARDIDAVTTSANAGPSRRVVRPIKDFRGWIRSAQATHPGSNYWQDAGTYREEIRQRLGVLPESFHRLIVKALSFKPIGQVRQFVFDYLLDPRPIDTAALQANLDHYKRLEGEAKDAEARIKELEEIVRRGERIESEQRTAESHRYLELRADLEAADTTSADLEEELGDTRAKLEGLGTRSQALDTELEQLEIELDRVRALLENLDERARRLRT
ncbi:MAG TPA: ATP-binding protein, partial [Planctomycetota bacterium]|nr:ATP-binding protein [Planctomycetota bacterium]